MDGFISVLDFSGLDYGVTGSDVITLLGTLTNEDKEKWKQTKVLIIDECTAFSLSLILTLVGQQVEGRYLEDMEKLARKLKNPKKFFGGIQIILFGDLYKMHSRMLLRPPCSLLT